MININLRRKTLGNWHAKTGYSRNSLSTFLWTKRRIFSHISEFPAILVDLNDQKVLSEFHQYIVPIESPTLSKFCTQLTGITQDIIDNDAVPLQTGLLNFNQWLTASIEKYDLVLPKTGNEQIPTCAFVTWSDWDFGVCLRKECNRKGITKSQHFDQWIDLKATFKVDSFKTHRCSFTDNHFVTPIFIGLVQVQTEEFRWCNEICWNDIQRSRTFRNRWC